MSAPHHRPKLPGEVPPGIAPGWPTLPVHAVVLAKAPLPGRAKTRLAPALGADGAARLARLLLLDTLDRVHAACTLPATPSLTAELCSDPGPGHADWAAVLPHGPSVHPSGPAWGWCDQGVGDLGQRMARASQRVTALGRAVLLVGTDCPGLSATQLRQAADQLQHHDAVMLPAADGGYVLLGLRQHVPELFEHMPWSTAQVASLTRDRLRAQGLSLWQGPMLHDIDELADMAHLTTFLCSQLF
jgi:hypothetical protein